jgi:hypothetical protein
MAFMVDDLILQMLVVFHKKSYHSLAVARHTRLSLRESFTNQPGYWLLVLCDDDFLTRD